MSGIFGGAQTVNTGQQTAQAANQSFANTSVNAANPLAVGLGQEVSSLAGVYSQPGWYGAAGFEAENPYSLYQLPDLNQTQTQAIGQLGQAGTSGAGLVSQGAQYYPQAGGYIGQGTQLMGQAGQAITPQDINAFQNPFTANVTANLQDIFGQQNTQNLIGSTAAAGGVGGERAAVGQALLAQRQGLTAGNIYADLYQRSLQAAEQQKAQQLAAGQGLTGAGQSIGSLGLQGVGAGVGAENAALQAGNVQFNRDVAAQALQRNYYTQRYQAPMQQASGIAQLMYPSIGLGQTAAQMGTSQTGQVGLGTGQTTFPAASPLGGIAGLGLAGAALFAARGGRINKKHKFDVGGAVDDIGGSPSADGLMQPQGMEDSGDGALQSTPADSSQIDPLQQPAQQQAQNSQQDNSLQQQNPQNPYPAPRFLGGQQQQKLQTRNRYALMSSLIANQARQQQRLPAPQIKWPQMRQEGGRIPLPRNRPFVLGPKDEETETQAHATMTPLSALSRRANPYYNTGDKNNLAGDMTDPGMRYPMQMVPHGLPSSGEAPGLYADGGAVGDDDNKIGGEAAPLGGMPPMAQAALSDDDDDDDETGGEAAPLGGAPRPAAQVNQVLSPYDTGVNPSVGAPGPSAGGMSPGKLALLQAGLGMMAASGQRDRHGLPMSPLAAIGQGGMQGVNAYQQQQVLAQRERAARESMMLKRMQLESLERHRQAIESMPHKIGVDPDLGTDIYGVRDPNAPGGFRRIDSKDLGYNAEVGTHQPSQAQVPAPRYSTDAPNAEADTEFDKEGDQDYLSTLSPDRRALLQKINRGEYPPPSMSSRSPRNMALLTQLSRAYPNSDLTVWKSRNETRAAFSKGVEGRAVSSLDMIAGHLDDYKQTIDNLAKHNVKGFNKIENAVRDQLGGTALSDFQVTRAAVSDELARVFQGAGVAAESEKKRWLIALDDAKSPAQARAVIHRLTSLIESRMGALAHQYDRGMNYDMNSPKARTNKGWLEGKPKEKFEGVKAWSAGSPKSEVSQKNPTQEEYDAMPKGTHYHWNGKTLVK